MKNTISNLINEVVINQSVAPIHLVVNLNEVIYSLKKDWTKFSSMTLADKLHYLFGSCMKQSATSSQYNTIQFEIRSDSVLVRVGTHKPNKRNFILHVESTDTLCIYDFRFNNASDGIQPISRISTPTKGDIPLETIFINLSHLNSYDETVTILRSFVSFFMNGGVYHHPFGSVSEGNLKLTYIDDGKIILTESTLRQIIRETIREMLYRA